MSVFRRTGSKYWYYSFDFAGHRIQASAKTKSKNLAKKAEETRRRKLEEGYNSIGDRKSQIQTIRQLASGFLAVYEVRHPRSFTSFARNAVQHVVDALGSEIKATIDSESVIQYQTGRLRDGAAPKTINSEVGLLLRILEDKGDIIRGDLRRRKQLKLPVHDLIGKAYSDQEKQALVNAARQAPRSRAIYPATLLAQHAGLRDREIRTLQWKRVDLMDKVIEVGVSKSRASSGRTIPMTEELHQALVEYVQWYAERFGEAKPEWYLFPKGKPRPSDPTQPQSSLKTAWRNVRSKAQVTGRWHDNRHTFVTDLAEAGVGDRIIEELAGHASRQMLRRYSHIRMQARRQAIEQLEARRQKRDDSGITDENRNRPPAISPAVGRVN